MIKKLIFGMVFVLLIMMEVGYIHYKLSTKLQALEDIQRRQTSQLYLMERATEKTMFKVNYLHYRSKQKQLQQNKLPGIYLAAN